MKVLSKLWFVVFLFALFFFLPTKVHAQANLCNGAWNEPSTGTNACTVTWSNPRCDTNTGILTVNAQWDITDVYGCNVFDINDKKRGTGCHASDNNLPLSGDSAGHFAIVLSNGNCFASSQVNHNPNVCYNHVVNLPTTPQFTCKKILPSDTPTITPRPTGTPRPSATPLPSDTPTTPPIPTSVWGSCLQEDPVSKQKDVATIQCVPIAVSFIIQGALMFSGAIALLFVLYAGYKYVISQGDAKKIDSARKTLTWAIIGLIIILCSFAIVHFLSTILNLPCLNNLSVDVNGCNS